MRFLQNLFGRVKRFGRKNLPDLLGSECLRRRRKQYLLERQ